MTRLPALKTSLRTLLPMLLIAFGSACNIDIDDIEFVPSAGVLNQAENALLLGGSERLYVTEGDILSVVDDSIARIDYRDGDPYLVGVAIGDTLVQVAREDETREYPVTVMVPTGAYVETNDGLFSSARIENGASVLRGSAWDVAIGFECGDLDCLGDANSGSASVNGGEAVNGVDDRLEVELPETDEDIAIEIRYAGDLVEEYILLPRAADALVLEASAEETEPSSEADESGVYYARYQLNGEEIAGGAEVRFFDGETLLGEGKTLTYARGTVARTVRAELGELSVEVEVMTAEDPSFGVASFTIYPSE